MSNQPATLEKDGWQIFVKAKIVLDDDVEYEKRKMLGETGQDVFLYLPPGMAEFQVLVRSSREEYYSKTRTKLTLVVEVRRE